MASDGTMTLHSSTHGHQLDYDDDIDSGYDDHLPHQVLNLSRLSVCTSNCIYGPKHDGDHDSAKFYEIDPPGTMSMSMPQLSIESFQDDADDEFDDQKKNYKLGGAAGLPSSSDSEPGYYSLPATPPRIRRKSQGGLASDRQVRRVKDYASENEAQKCARDGSICRRKRKRRIRGHRWLSNAIDNYNTASTNWMSRKKGEDNMTGTKNAYSGGESESGVMLIARPKGGRRSLCMDLEEVKACRDLGFELEHERMLEMPSRVSISAGSTVDTSSGGNSPIAHWHISSPGDDPRDVKARLKIWAQAVALASTSRPTG